MARDKLVDMDQQCLDLFSQEEMFAFFDFSFHTGQGKSLSGLCKISRPKERIEPREHGSKSHYISICFFIDVPEEGVLTDIDSFMKAVDWSALSSFSSGIQCSVPMPYLSPGMRIYFKEVDLYVSSSTRISRPFMLNKLYPGLLTVTGFSGGELVFWDDLSLEMKNVAPTSIAGGEAGQSFMGRLRSALRSKK